MSYTVKGTIKSVGETQQITDSFSKREFRLLDESSQYPQVITFEMHQERVKLLDGFNTDDKVEVEIFFNVRGREYTDKQNRIKSFNSLVAWKIDKVIKDERPPEQQITGGNNKDDLPF